MRNEKLSFKRRNLPQLLLQAREAVLARFRPLLNEAGFTEQQWRIVRALVEHGPLEPRQIVPLCGISSPSLTGILSRMEETGLVKRERIAEDQRRLLVTATPKSRMMASKIAPKVEEAYEQLESEVDATLLDHLYESLTELIEKIESEVEDA
ncbi:MAG: homoprotocatechuate degradation operon regulator HpaR [Curvibacter sp. PD_MW3]|nr:MAG: homoprotocatechuate degradation operon regulator HpaR [Curvibacter sp. PD_MW3]